MADFSTMKLFLFLCKVYFKNLLTEMTYQLMDAGRSSKISLFLTLVNLLLSYWGLPGGSVVKNLPASTGDAEDAGSIPGSKWSPGEGNGSHPNILAWEPLGRGAWWAAAHRHDLVTEHTQWAKVLEVLN